MPFHPDGPAFADHSWWAGGGAHIAPLVLFAILIGVLVWAVLRLTSSKDPAGPSTVDAGRADGALEEVRVRYARGEMSREEFVQRFRDLGGTGVDAVPLSPPAADASAHEPMPPTDPTPPAA